MSRHQKRLSVPDSWPVERKTDTFTVKAGAGPHGEAGVPLVVLLRDVLGYVDDRKEARYALGQHGVLVNGEPAADEDRPIGMFDILGFPDRAEFYRVFPDEGGRLSLTPIDADAADSRLGKVAGKRQVDGGATQLTLHDGTNVTVDDATAYATTDSLVIDVDDKSVVAHFPFEEDSLVTAIQGNHAGKIGRIDAIDVTAGSGSNIVHVRTDDDGFETVEEYVVVIDEQFAESTDAQSSSDASAVEGGEVEDAGGADEGDVDESEDVDSDESDDEPETDPTDETTGDEESTDDDASEDANDADGGEDAPDGGEDA